MVDRQVLMDAVEGSIFTLPDIPGVITVLEIPGIAAMHGPIPSPELNTAGMARLTSETVDGTIAQVQHVFRELNKVCGWWVTPNSRPEDLAEHLEQAGYGPVEYGAGMVLTDLDRPIATNPRIRVERSSPAELAAAAPMVTRSYGLPAEAGDSLVQFMTGVSEHADVGLYLGYVGDSREPVAWSVSLYLPGVPIVVLQGAGTLPEQRGQGMYSTMVARRLKDARDRGMEAAVIQANRNTSAPIAEKLGFREILPLTLYAWDPADGS